MTALFEEFDVKKWLEARARATPWWALSIGFHALALACLGLIQFAEHVVAKDAAGTVITVAGKPKERVEMPPDARRDLFTSAAALPHAGPSADHEVKVDDRFELGDHFERDVGGDGTGWGAEHESPDYSSGVSGGDVLDLGKSLGADPRGRDTAMGVGPGGGRPGGIYGDRTPGGRRNMVADLGRSSGGTTEDAVQAGLKWLARHQGADGGWHATSFSAGCAAGTACSGGGYDQFDAGLTGLALLAFLGSGYTPLERRVYDDLYTHQKIGFGKVVRKAVDYLARVQDADGCYGPRSGEFMYNHAIAALAMAEAYGMTNAASLRAPAQRGIDFLSAARNPYRAWRYTVKPGDNDTSVTGWCVMALKSAAISGLAVARTDFDGAREWLDSVTDEAGEVGYNGKGRVDVVVKGKNDAWVTHPSMTAVGLLSRIFIDHDATDARLERHAARLAKDLPRWASPAAERPIDFYYWYYGSLALFQYDGPDGRHWRAWNHAMKDALLPHQAVRRDGCADGSWDPAVDRWGFAGGRVYATAMNVLTLEVYYRYGKVFGGRK